MWTHHKHNHELWKAVTLPYFSRMTEQQIRDEIFSKQGMQGISTEPKWSTLAETRLLMLMVKYKPVGWFEGFSTHRRSESLRDTSLSGIHKHNNLGHLHMYMNHIYAFEDGVGCFLYDADHAEYASQLGLPPHLRSGAYTPKYYIRPSVEQVRTTHSLFVSTFISSDLDLGENKHLVRPVVG